MDNVHGTAKTFLFLWYLLLSAPFILISIIFVSEFNWKIGRAKSVKIDCPAGFYLGIFVWGRSQFEWPKSILGGPNFLEMDMCWDVIWCIKIFMILRHNSEWPEWSQLFWGGSFHPSNPLDRTLSGSDTFLCDSRTLYIYSFSKYFEAVIIPRTVCFGYVNLKKELSY